MVSCTWMRNDKGQLDDIITAGLSLGTTKHDSSGHGKFLASECIMVTLNMPCVASAGTAPPPGSLAAPRADRPPAPARYAVARA